MNDTLAIRKKRLRFQSWHRGCKETDVILGHFCDQHLEAMSESDLDAFEALLAQDDADLFRWLTGELPVPQHLQANPMLARLQSFDVRPHLIRHGTRD